MKTYRSTPRWLKQNLRLLIQASHRPRNPGNIALVPMKSVMNRKWSGLLPPAPRETG